ncbi:hypothetical protein KY289_003036 [Solanum tuberosum]|nr:hypothetical protein KY289_003036 [Solanum tuberosum]
MFDPDCQVLKLLSLVYRIESIGYVVLDLQNEESSCCWRPLVLNLPEQSQGETRIRNKQSKNIGVVFGMGIGYIFWDIDNGVPNPSIGIDVLDMVNDRYIGYTTFPMNHYYTKDECILWNGKLSFAKIVKDELHMLVLEFDYKKHMKLIDSKLVVKLPFIT